MTSLHTPYAWDNNITWWQMNHPDWLLYKCDNTFQCANVCRCYAEQGRYTMAFGGIITRRPNDEGDIS